jgi:hypothetical protein
MTNIPSYATIDETPKPVTLLLKGDSGTGKTFKAAQFPRPVIWNFDNNLSGLRKLPEEVRKGVRVLDPRRNAKGEQVKDIEVWKNFTEQLEEVGQDPSVGTMVIDSLTTMAEILMDKILKTDDPGKAVEIQNWGEFARYMKWLGEHLLCANDLDKHVVFLAHESILQEKLTGKIKYQLAVGGQSKSNFDLYFTDVWRSYTKPAKDGGVEYWIRTLPTDYHTAKSSLALPPDFKWDEQKDSIMKQLTAGLPQTT